MMATCEHCGQEIPTQAIGRWGKDGKAHNPWDCRDALCAQLTLARREAEEARGRALGEAAEVCDRVARTKGDPHNRFATDPRAAFRSGACKCAWEIRALAPVAQEAEDVTGVLRWLIDAAEHGPPEWPRDHTCGPEGACDADCMDRAAWSDGMRRARKLLASRAPAVKR